MGGAEPMRAAPARRRSALPLLAGLRHGDRRARVAVEGVVSAAVMAVLVWLAHPARIGHVLAHTRLDWLLPTLFLSVATVPVMAYRWQLLLAAKGLRQPLGWLTRTYFVALFAGQFLPAAIGGDAVRAVELGRRSGDASEAVASVLIDRLVGVVSLIVLALVAVGLGGRAVGGVEVVAAEAAFGVAALLVLGLLFAAPVRGWVARVLEPRVDGRRLAAGQRFYEALHAYRDARGTLVAVSVLALAVQAVRIVMIWMLARALRLPVPIGTAFVTGPVLFAALILPVSLNGIGVREAVFVYFLRDSTTTAQAVALGVAFLVVGSATALVGALVLAVRFLRHGAGVLRPPRRIE